MKKMLFLFLAVIFISGCAGINYSQMSPEAKDFHPKTIAVLPATVGEHESSRDIIDTVVSSSLLKSGWYQNVVDSVTIKTQVSSSSELANDLTGYIQKMNTLGISDSAVISKLNDSLHTEALLLTYVTSWGYGREDGDKVARVGIGLKLVNAGSGQLIWKANHEIIEDYTFFKPSLDEMAKEVMTELLDEMPH